MNALDWCDTIAAAASPPGGGWEGILRLSGERCLEILSAVFTPDLSGVSRQSPARVVRGMMRLAGDWGCVPAIASLWPGERSYTRQPSAELRLPGAPVLLEQALATLVRAGARLARPGEFTLRAFLAGRLDLTQAEAVLGVIDARDEAQLQVALAQLGGGLAAPLAELRRRMLDLLADLEAGLDFVDEDLDLASPDLIARSLRALENDVAALSARLGVRGNSAERPRVVLVGQPNAGKSSLFNALAGSETALVSPLPGATRDYLSADVEFCGLPVRLLDTAGLDRARVASEMDEVERFAQEQTQAQRQQGDLLVLCLDPAQQRTAWETDLLRQSFESPPAAAPVVVAHTKFDLPPPRQPNLPTALTVSSVSGAGLEALRRAVAEALAARWGEATPSTAARCRESLARTSLALARASHAAEHSLGDELIASELRLALEDLGLLVGAVVTDDLLDRIFSRFCIGK